MKLPELVKNELMPLSRHVGSTIRRLRKAMRLSQRAFAKCCDLSRTNLGRVERGEQSLELDTLERMAVILRITPVALLAMTELEAY
jgi:transcriptional regulator with XRE-family HTH domain